MGNDEIINEGSQPEVEKLRRILRNLLIIFISILVTLSLIIFILFLVPVLKEVTSGQRTVITNNLELKQDASYKKKISLMTRNIQLLSRKYSAYTSGQSYIVINTTDNRFFLYRNKKLIREGFCSSGSYTMLQTEGDKKWIFKTPKGKYWIHGKTTNPVWKKPDWAFVEEGLPIPSKDDFSRYEYGVLGDYALAIGDGYLIHGTIYKRFLGMPVTHGCVRLNDEDLEVIFNTLSIGSKVYIF
ncbi:MAG: L,D-transpeptidase [Bacteroidales bacterium]|nr:L,D-transpeptidase [Bacteroidales bacterium]